MGCGCKKNKSGGCSGPHCPPESQPIEPITYRFNAMAKSTLDDYAVSGLVRVTLKTRGPKREVYGMISKRFLGRYSTGEMFLMPREDYNEAVRQRRTSYELESEGFDFAVLPHIGEKLAAELRFTHKIFSKKDLLDFGVNGLVGLHPTITEEVAQEILDVLIHGPKPTEVVSKKSKKKVVEEELPVQEEVHDEFELPVATD
jgi:hypothetical protein